MLSPRWHKVIRDLWGNKARTTLVVLSIAVGVFAIGMIGTSQITLGKAMTDSWNAINPAHANISTSGADPSIVEKVRSVSGVEQAEGNRQFSIRVNVGADEWKNVAVTAFPDFNHININKISPIKGDWPPATNELLLERTTLEWLKVKIGDKISIESASGVKREIKVGGTVHDLSRPPVVFSSWGAGYVTMQTLPWLGEPDKLNKIDLTVANEKLNEEHIRAVAAKVSTVISQNGVTVRGLGVPTPGEHPVSKTVNSLMMILGVLGLVALILSGFLVVNVISAMLAQQTRQIGVMKAVGARTSQIVGLYMGTVFVFGVLALLIGVPAGAGGAMAFTGFIGGLLNLNTGFDLPPSILAIEIGIGLLVPALAAVVPVFAGTRVSTREALSGNSGGKPYGEGLIDRTMRRVPLSRPMQLSLRNTFRRKGRLALTLGTLILGGAVFMGVFSTRASIQRTLDNALAYFAYDFHSFTAEPIDTKKAEELALKVPGVVKAEGWGWYDGYRLKDGKLQKDGFNFVTPRVGTTLIKPTVVEGQWLKTGSGNNVVVNSDFLKDAGDLKLGDDFTARVLGQDMKLHISGVVTGQLSGGVIFADPAYVAPIVKQSGLSTFLVVETDQHDATYQRKTGLKLEEEFRKGGLPIGNTETTTTMKSRASNNFNIIIVFFLVMAVVLAVVGGLGLAGTMSINVLERTREIGVMRAIGASTMSILNVFLFEGMLIGGVSWIFGAVLAMPFGEYLSKMVGINFAGAPLDYVYSTTGAVAWLAASIFLAALSSFMPSRRAAKLSVREVLAYE